MFHSITILVFTLQTGFLQKGTLKRVWVFGGSSVLSKTLKTVSVPPRVLIIDTFKQSSKKQLLLFALTPPSGSKRMCYLLKKCSCSLNSRCLK